MEKPFAGTLCLVNNNNPTEKIFIETDKSLNFKDDYTPIGVVVVPVHHNVYGNQMKATDGTEDMVPNDLVINKKEGAVGVMSLLAMSTSSRQMGQNTETNIRWYMLNEDAGMTKFDTVNIVSEARSNILSGKSSAPSLPSTPSTGTYNLSADGVAQYPTYSRVEFAPSPYLVDGSRNPIYYSREISAVNALSDFNGDVNTEYLLNKWGSRADAVDTCSRFKTLGTESGDWYLPACGELGYVVARLGEIKNAINVAINTWGNDVAALMYSNPSYWSSTQYSTQRARQITTSLNQVTSESMGLSCPVRAFIRICP